MTEEECSICGLDLKEKFCHELKCNHSFHYECVMKSFMNTPKSGSGNKGFYNSCPYCRTKSDFLPVINGLKKVVVGIHAPTISECSKIKICNETCKYTLKRGKNKGNQCSKNCFLGYEYCKIHKKTMKI